MVTIHALRTLLTGRLLPWAIVAFVIVSAAHAGTSTPPVVNNTALRALAHRVTLLEHACVPTRTGGGVMQCAQPSIPEQRAERAVRDCDTNTAYVGLTDEDTWALHAQCLDDWHDAHQ